MDLHIHTPASKDYQQSDSSYLDLLKQAELRGLDMIAFTDHNTVSGYRKMHEEIRQLSMLEDLNRMLPEEQIRLKEYRRLLGRIQVLPGFEFTATFGFHIIGVFSPETTTREIEHILLNLNIPEDQLDDGSVTIGAGTDVLTVYRLINEAGGLVIAAHANSNNGVAMRGFPIGGQTKIAYTQDINLHALEVTDLERRGRRTTATFFNGTKPEYPRRMHCIQGSDSHRLNADPKRNKVLGLGERATDVYLPELSFEALRKLFLGNDFSRTRPHRHKAAPVFDYVQEARREGANIVQDFHQGLTVRGGKRYAIIADTCGFANTNGGTLYIGLSSDPQQPITGVSNPKQAISQLESEISNRISPELSCSLDVQTTGGKKIVRILIPHGDDPPYAVDDNKIYLRSETETGLAVRDEIVAMVLRGKPEVVADTTPLGASSRPVVQDALPPVGEEPETELRPRTGVEIVEVEKRKGVNYFTVRDLRNGSMVKNVTQKSARKLWHQAITRFNKLPKDLSQFKVQWHGDLGLLETSKYGKSVRYELVQRTADGYRYYYGVTDDGIHGAWKQVVGLDDS
jgi:predicted metal-dependent phosphoesterase TrpH